MIPTEGKSDSNHLGNWVFLMSEELLQRDWEFILDMICRINMTTSIESYAKEALEYICSLIPCDQGTFFPFEESRGFYEAYADGLEAKYFDEFLTGSFEDDIFFKLMTVKSHSYAFRDSDLIPDRVFLYSRLYNEIYIPQGIRWPLRIELIHGGKLIGQFALFNKEETGDFNERDVYIGNLLAQHLTLKLHALQTEPSSVEAIEKQAADLAERYNLTAREGEVVGLALEGLTDPEIAETLFISVSTVKKHLYNAFAKIGINNRLQLLARLR